MEISMHNLHFKSPDPVKSAQWYVDNLGANKTSEVVANGGIYGVVLDLHGVTLLISKFTEGQELEQVYGLEHIGLYTDDLAGWIEQVKAAGSQILEERITRFGEECCFIDGPEGVRLEMTQIKE